MPSTLYDQVNCKPRDLLLNPRYGRIAPYHPFYLVCTSNRCVLTLCVIRGYSLSSTEVAVLVYANDFAFFLFGQNKSALEVIALTQRFVMHPELK